MMQSAVLRPRSTWEALDFGHALVRHYAWPIYRLWLCVFIPWTVLVVTLLPSIGAAFALWWCKPLYDRLVLYVLARSLFAQPPSLAQAWQDRRQILRGWFWSLSLGRLDPARGFALPIVLLEQLSGKARRQRFKLLGRDGSFWVARAHVAVWAHLEGALLLTLILVGWQLLPEEWRPSLEEVPIIEQPFNWLGVLAYATVISCLEPFYIGADFGLYLNRRCHLEGWDLEQPLRDLGQRLRVLGQRLIPSLALLVLGLSVALMPNPSWADTPKPVPLAEQQWSAVYEYPAHQQRLQQLRASSDASKRALAEVLQQPDLQRWREVEVLQNCKAPPEEAARVLPSPKLDWFNDPAQWLRGLVIVLLVGLLVAVVVWAKRNQWQVSSFWRKSRRVPNATAQELELDPVLELPDDVLAAARQAWASGKLRLAVSLLYRCLPRALQNRCELTPAETEEQILSQLRQQHLAPPTLEYCQRLISLWQALAYADRIPSAEQFESLCQDWERFLPSPHEGKA